MDRLSIVLTPVTGAVITGFVVIVLFSLGFYSWVAVAVAATIGCIGAWPAAYRVSRRIKDEDPLWRTRDPQTQRRLAPNAGLPEV